MNAIKKLALGLSASVAALFAGSAAALDLTAPTATLATVQTDIETVGLLVIGLAAVAMGIRWVKATFF
jgi:hypothetical protein